ncbi:hypothetical protein PMAYCL1PPCAC_11409, partial [Pristionchus mayeri]
ALIDEEFTSRHGRLVRMNVLPDKATDKLCTTIRKGSLFSSYRSLRHTDAKNPFPEENLTKRINPLSGNEIQRDRFRMPFFMPSLSDSPFSPSFEDSLPPYPQNAMIKRGGRKPVLSAVGSRFATLSVARSSLLAAAAAEVPAPAISSGSNGEDADTAASMMMQ